VVFPSSLCGVGCDKRSCSDLGIFVVCCVGNLDIYLSLYIFRYRLAFCMTCDGRAVWSNRYRSKPWRMLHLIELSWAPDRAHFCRMRLVVRIPRVVRLS
jgi:hypothetical protein